MRYLKFCLAGLMFLIPLTVHSQIVDTMFLRLFNGAGNDIDLLGDMAISRQGTVFVTGIGYRPISADDYWTIACDAWGRKLWEAYYGGSDNDNDSAAAIAVDSRGDVYVTGQTYEAGKVCVTTIKYSGSGVLLWAKPLCLPGDLDDGGVDIVTVDSTAVYACAYRHIDGFDIDFLTIRYNPATGDTVWTRSFSRAGEADEDMPTAITADRSGNIIVTGYSYHSNSDYDFCTLKYDPAGTLIWYRYYNNRPDNGEDYAYAVATDANNNVLVTGTSYDDITDFDYLTLKYGVNGESLWVRRYNRSPANAEDIPCAIITDPLNNVYVTGTSYDSLSEFDYTTICYTASGSASWNTRSDRRQLDEFASGIALDANGNVYVTGTSNALVTDNDIFTVKLNGFTGVPLWEHEFDNTAHAEDNAIKIALGTGNAIFVAGQSFTDLGNMDYALMRIYEATHDCGVARIYAPADTIFVNETVYPSALVKNYGYNPETVKLKMIITGRYLDSLLWFVDVGDSETITFRPYVESLPGTYAVSCTALLSGDVNPLNDAVRDSFHAVVLVGIKTEPRQLVVVSPSLSVSPNPVRDIARISYAVPDPEHLRIILYDASGRLVRKVAGPSQTRFGNLDVNLAGLASGIYLLKLDTPRYSTSRKLLKLGGN